MEEELAAVEAAGGHALGHDGGGPRVKSAELRPQDDVDKPRDDAGIYGAVVELEDDHDPRGGLRHVAEEPGKEAQRKRFGPRVRGTGTGDHFHPHSKGHRGGHERTHAKEHRAVANAHEVGNQAIMGRAVKEYSIHRSGVRQRLSSRR